MAENDPLESLLGHVFADPALLDSALTHGSSQTATSDYQRLEFLGDRVLSLVVAEALYHRFPQEKEGPMAARLSLLVRAEACAYVGERLQLGRFIKVGKVEKRKGVHNMASVVADVIEAVIGALYLEAGYAKTRDFVLQAWNELLVKEPSSLKDAKTFVQEWALARALALPHYAEVGRAGPQHAPVFSIALRIGEFAPVAGRGGSKQQAEMDAAQNFITREGLR
ncbi:MAG TPA: ribonuclease III [Aestuariivirga sp.]